MTQWMEVNLLPAEAAKAERLLTGVVDPLVHKMLGDGNAPDRWDRWHFFWEPELRLRFRWASGADVGKCRETVTGHLAKAQGRRRLASWAEVPYDGEAADYGHQVWEAVITDWMGGSELALALLKAGRSLPEGRSFYWERHQHLFANQINVPEVALCLWQARARLEQFWPEGNPRIEAVCEAISRFLDDGAFVRSETAGLTRGLARRLAAQKATPAPRTGAPAPAQAPAP